MELGGLLDGEPRGTVVEVRSRRGVGPVVTAILRQGSLRVGDVAVAGQCWGRVRSLESDAGAQLTAVGPSVPFRIVGMRNGEAHAGMLLIAVPDEAVAKDVCDARTRIAKEEHALYAASSKKQQLLGLSIDSQSAPRPSGSESPPPLDLLSSQPLCPPPTQPALQLVVKASSFGSLQAVLQALTTIQNISTRDSGPSKINVVASGVGDVSSSDVATAVATNAIIVGYDTKADSNRVLSLATAQNVDVTLFSVIYDLLDHVKNLLRKRFASSDNEIVSSLALVKKVFDGGRFGKIAGCVVQSGRIVTAANARVMRSGHRVFTGGTIHSIKVDKLAAGAVDEGNECGVSLATFTDFREGDLIETYL
jgi:translation initiation factor IF-2